MVKRILRVVFWVLFFIMALLTLVRFSGIAKELFWCGGSSYVFADFFSLSVIYPLSFLALYLFILIKFKRRKILSNSLCLILIVFWTLSGRTIAIGYESAESRIVTGWFYIPTNIYTIQYEERHLSTEENETTEEYRTIKIDDYRTIKKLSFCRIEIQENQNHETFFIGPFLWKKMKKSIITI